MAGDQQTLGKGTGQFLLQSLQEGPMFADTLTLASEWWENKVSVVLSHEARGAEFYGSPVVPVA